MFVGCPLWCVFYNLVYYIAHAEIRFLKRSKNTFFRNISRMTSGYRCVCKQKMIMAENIPNLVQTIWNIYIIKNNVFFTLQHMLNDLSYNNSIIVLKHDNCINIRKLCIFGEIIDTFSQIKPQPRLRNWVTYLSVFVLCWQKFRFWKEQIIFHLNINTSDF